MFDIQEQLKQLPASPGVYLHKDRLGQVIYVGKAVSLRNRVRQYFQSSKNMDAKVRAMVGHIAEFEYITCGSEMEALILECNLIKKHRPKYNILLRDDKTYPYIRVTTASEEFPRILKTRRVGKEGDQYFGPYSDAGAVNQMIDLLNRTYRLKRCSRQTFPKGYRPCLNAHIGQCDGICRGQVSREDYGRRLEEALAFLKGRDRTLTDYLRNRMEQASEAMDYEAAARYRDQLQAAEGLTEQQRVVLKQGSDLDVVLPAGEKHMVTFFVRQGKLVGRETYPIQRSDEDEEGAVLAAFLKLHYGGQTAGPSEILVDLLPEDSDLIREYLAKLWGSSLHILAPQRGERRHLLDLARKDVAEMEKTIQTRQDHQREREAELARALGEVLQKVNGTASKKDGEEPHPYRLEAYDISNTNGVDTVGAMVVFSGSQPERKAYRKFKVRTVDGPDDYSSMQEVLYRRLKRAEADDPGFSTMPDAFLIDGGRGHVQSARAVTDAMGISIPVLGLAKDDHHRTRALVWMDGEEFMEEELATHPILFQYLGTIQEEVHRFAIDYHRSLRDKGKLHSVLDEIPGIGEKRRNALLAAFGSVEKIKNAGRDELLAVEGIRAREADAILSFFS